MKKESIAMLQQALASGATSVDFKQSVEQTAMGFITIEQTAMGIVPSPVEQTAMGYVA
ncbi:hypothetical protein [Undibacterium terreum]|uniref:Uncharacterized protein n=1 Tax=Undibacterium terreum TaxID=1224302 RepID=A0A916UVN1_9BURK|nr:hypothetical protein [Undibacterium terreum]GGC90738.1 hypothetical protein GCM10011396_42490 [Undibacterium terreum]